jgi:hypothetical protein
MADRETRVTVSRTVTAPDSKIFAVLADPANHPAIDGSGMVKASVDATPIGAVGESFVMDMEQEPLGKYQTENTVCAFEVNRTIAWKVALRGQPAHGLVWAWDLTPVDGECTEVAVSCDWSAITDEKVLARVKFPRVSPEQMRASIDRLAGLVG